MIIEVKDKDKGRDGLVNVTIVSGNWNNTFFIKYCYTVLVVIDFFCNY